MKKHKEATAQEQSCAVASFLFFRVERTDQNEDSADHIDCRDRSRARRPLGSSGSALVEAGRVELPSENPSMETSPGADGYCGSLSPCSPSGWQAVTPSGQVRVIMRGRGNSYPPHVRRINDAFPALRPTRFRRLPLVRQRQQYDCCQLIFKLPVLWWPGATARYSCFRVPVETGTPPRRHKVCSAPFPPGGESFAGSLAPPHRTGPACAGLRFGWRLRRRARNSYFNPAGHSAPQA